MAVLNLLSDMHRLGDHRQAFLQASLWSSLFSSWGRGQRGKRYGLLNMGQNSTTDTLQSPEPGSLHGVHTALLQPLGRRG